MKTLLVNPPLTYLQPDETIRLAIPLGICYIAAVLEQHGYCVQILDAHAEGFENRITIDGNKIYVGLTGEQIKQRIEDFHPDILGVSCLFTDQLSHPHAICKMAKEVDPNIITILGGVYCSTSPREALADPNVDFILRGEAEYSFLDFCQGKRDVDGLNLSPKEHFIEDLDALPLPARHLLPIQRYFEAEKAYREPPMQSPAIPMITSRGCPARCRFCASNLMQGHYRERSVENVIAEVEHLIDTYGMREIYFLDDALAHGNFREILREMIRRDFDLTWHGANGMAVYSLDDDLINLCVESGCYKIILGIESGNQHTLNYMRKPQNIEQIRNVVRKIKDHGMRVEGLFLLGMPNDTKEDMLNTVKFADELELSYASFPIATPFPGTSLYEDCEKRGYLVKLFKFENLKFGMGNIRTENFDPEWVENLRRDAWRRINHIDV